MAVVLSAEQAVGDAGDAACVRLLGSFALTSGGVEHVPALATQKVVALLALHGPSMPRLQIAGTLWPEKSDQRALANLRSALWRLDEWGDILVTSDANTVSLRERVAVDVRDLETRWAELPAAPLDLAGVLDATRRYAAALLPGWYEDWVVFERERLRQVQLLGLEALARALTAAGRTAEAVLAGLAAVAREPLRESAHRVVIEAHLAAGNVVEARRQLQLCRSYLLEQLGVAPSPDLVAMVETEVAEHGSRRNATPAAPRIRRFATDE